MFGIAGLAAALIVVIIILVAGGDDDTTAPPGAAADAGADPAAISTFQDTCGQCHTLTVAGTNGDVGPDLDDERFDTARVLNAIKNGAGNGEMAPGLLQGADAQAVADLIGNDDPALATPQQDFGGN